MVSLAQTHGNSFGSFVTAPRTGIILNHGMWRFDPSEGQPYANLGKLGRRPILTGLAELVVHLLDFGLTPMAALVVARFHCQTKEPVWLERRAYGSLYQDFIDRGHQVEWHDQVGSDRQPIVVDQATQTLRAGVAARSDASVQGI